MTTLALLVSLLPPASAIAEDEASIVIMADTPCAIIYDDVFIFRIEAEAPRTMSTTPGNHDLAALSTVARGVFWQDTIQVDEGEQLEIVITILDDVDFELEAIARAPNSNDDDYEHLERSEHGTILDTESGLEWTPVDNQFNVDWVTAERYCSTMRLGEGATEGEQPWRLPSIEELRGLVDDSSYGDYWIVGLLRLSGCCAWSAESHGSISAWYMDFTNGRRGFVTRDFSDNGRVLCVRESAAAEEQMMGWR